MGNGSVESGDGYRFRGRGPIQITGRDNYTSCGAAIGIDLITAPESLVTPIAGVASANWYWRTRGCNELAVKADHVAITKKINGGTTGLEDRIRLFDKVYKEIT